MRALRGRRRGLLISCQALLRGKHRAVGLTLRPGVVERPALQTGGLGGALGRRRRRGVVHDGAGSCPLLQAPGVLPATGLVRQNPLPIDLLLRCRGWRLRAAPLGQDGRPAACKLCHQKGRGAQPPLLGLEQRLDVSSDVRWDALCQGRALAASDIFFSAPAISLTPPGMSTLAPTATGSQKRQLPARRFSTRAGPPVFCKAKTQASPSSPPQNLAEAKPREKWPSYSAGTCSRAMSRKMGSVIA